MRYLISLLLLFAILENVISDDSIKKRMLRVALKLKEIQKRKEMQRKLQDGIEAIEENTAQPVPTIVEPTIPQDIPYNDTGDGNPESSDPFGNDTILPPNKPFHTPKKKDNKNANIQPIKYHSYGVKKPTTDNPFYKIEFKVYIYIFGIPIPKTIVYRLRIVHNSKLRSLQDGGDESVKSECKLDDPSIAGQNATEGRAPNYNCEANTKNDPGDAQVAINTDVDMAYSKPDGSFEYLSFEEINFNGNSSEEATNLQQSTDEVPHLATLKNGVILKDGDTHTLRIEGSQFPGGVFKLGENITMSFENLYKSGEDNVEPYECTINSSTPFILNCDTSRHSIRTSPKSLHLTSGVSNITSQRRRAEEDVQQKLLMIEMDDYNNTNTVDYYTTGSNAKYRKKSSGLSGGAIAGIVIACVVVLVAASIAAIMLRKPSPPIDNSTVVGLKSTDNI
jgi:hypothetical protein